MRVESDKALKIVPIEIFWFSNSAVVRPVISPQGQKDSLADRAYTMLARSEYR